MKKSFLGKSALVAGTALICSLFTLSAQSAIVSTMKTDDDATLILNLEDTLYNGVNQEWGSVQILINQNDVNLSSGDTVDISVYEDDAFIDDLLWSTTFTVSSSEASAGLVDRIFPVVFTPEPEGAFPDGFVLEIYAEATVDKADCGTFCMNDNPTTNKLDVTVIDAPSPVPVPAAAWLFGSAILGLTAVKRKKA